MSMKFRSQLRLPALQRFLIPGIDDFVRRTIEGAAREWVKEAVRIIPVWSGASRATLQALANAVGESVPISPVHNAPDRVALGRVYSRGGIEKEGRARWQFYYETQLRYLIANETKRVAPRTEGLRGSMLTPTPFKFREAGERAAQKYIDEQLKNLPLSGLFRRRTI